VDEMLNHKYQARETHAGLKKGPRRHLNNEAEKLKSLRSLIEGYPRRSVALEKVLGLAPHPSSHEDFLSIK